MVPIVAIIALCMSRTDHRRGRYIKMAPAFLVYLAYLMLLANARSAIAEGQGRAMGLWSVHLIFLLVAVVMLYGPTVRGRIRHRRYLNAQA
jgi:lipopolysaccharide export system permease protein